MPESNKTSTTQIICKDCRTNVGTVKCRCSKECMLCNTCATRTRERAVKHEWYLPYILWCDNCVWFDIS